MPSEGDLANDALRQYVELFAEAGVDIIVIGGQAARLHGSPLQTLDNDFCYRRTSDNLERLAQMLRRIHPTLRGAPADLPFLLDARALALGSNFTFDTDVHKLDLLGYVEPLGGYDELLSNATTRKVGQHQVQVIGLEDLITIKQHINRPKDRQGLLQLLAIRQLRQEQADRGD